MFAHNVNQSFLKVPFRVCPEQSGGFWGSEQSTTLENCNEKSCRGVEV